MKAKEFIPATKPRNFVAKNAQSSGAGRHQNSGKKKEQGKVKHKKDLVPMESAPDGWEGTVKAMKKHKDIDNPYALAWSMKNKGYKSHKKEDVAEATGNDFRVGQKVIYTTSNGQKFPSIVTAVDFDEDAVKIKSANNKPFPNSGGDIEIVVDPGWKFLTPEPGVDPNSVIAVSPSMRKTTERVRDPEDWDEGNTEPPNNFAVYINGKKWKVFKGRGQYADDAREQAHYEQLKGWAAKKSAATGKQWSVSITGEPATE
jgi:hypothetical protein